jgi:hypothetical protein
MSGNELRHLAVIDSPSPARAADPTAAVLASCARAAGVARLAFAAEPGLLAFSWVDPGLDGLLRGAGPAASTACAAGVRALGTAAAELGAALRVCGRTDDLGVCDPPPTAGGARERTILWFQRYSGRDEIVRAAVRFRANRPGETLADGELDAFLDTAGVPDPDLLLYVGDPLEPRDALLWQGSYAEIVHGRGSTGSLSAADLSGAVAEYRDRQRRFGR